MKKKLWKDEEKRDSVYRDLAPINSIKPEEESIRALRWAIKNPNVHNIALSGPYGSGKSSVIQSYLAYYDISNIYKIFECIIPSKLSGILKIFPKSSKENLRISLATFDESNENNIEKDELQRGILKQLFYKVDASRIPLSRYRKLHHIKWYRYVIAVTLIILLIVSGIYLKSPEDTCNFFIHYLEGLSKTEIIMRGGIALFLVGGISYLLWVCTSRFRIKSITVGDVTAEGKGTEEESILDQNIDEILYFFEKTKYKVVFIEDLDRFNDTEIFVKLRELNEILNGYEVLNKRGKITFVYAVRDDLFKKEAERTKFFDFIIPVIPVINSTNSDEVMKTILKIGEQYVKDNERPDHEISKDFIKLVYPFVGNMRILISIINEFWIYKRMLKKDSTDKLDDEKIMALMIYKNLYPQDFSDLEDERGMVKEAFEQKDKLMKMQGEKLNEKKNDILTIIKCAPNSVREIKILILAEFRKNIREDAHSFTYVTKSNARYENGEILKDDFSMDVFRGQEIKVEYLYGPGYTRHSSNTDWFTEHSSSEIEELFERYDKYKKLEMNSIKEAKKGLQETDRKIQELRANTLQQLLLNKEFEEELPEEVKNNSLLMVLLRNGYINENYADYINYFREGAISRSELNFIRTVRNNQGECQFDYVIYHHANVIEKLFDYEFDQTELLNYSLMDYMLQNCIESPQMKILIKQVTNRSRKSREFINCYLVREQNIPKFVKQITATSKHIWEDIVEDVLLTEDNKTYYLNVILSYAAIECIKENDFVLPDTGEGAIAQYICSKPDIFERLEDVKPDKWVQIIENLGVDFYKVNLQRTDKKILEVIIDNWLYQLNDYMIKEIVQILKPEYLPQLFVKNYFCLRMLQQRQILDYIDEYINEYVETIIIGEKTNTEECREDVERIIEALLNKNQDSYSLCEKILKKEHLAHWDTFAEFLPQRKEAKDLWKYLLIYNRITASWENCIAYYEAFEMIDDILCSYIDNNIEQICINQECNRDENDEPFKMSYQFLKELLVSHIGYDTFEKIISKYRIQSFDYQCNEFEEDRLYLMVQKKYIPFSADILKELKEMSQQLWLNYIKNYKEKFLDDLAVSEIDLDDVKSLIRSDIFSGKEVKNILEEIDVTKIDVELSKMLLVFSEEVIFEKTYVEAVWEELPEENRYRWLYNQMDAYNLDELAEHFVQLEATYHQFAQRTQHKYKVHNNEFNMQLCEKLKRRGFLTSVNYKGKWIEGYVKKAV